MFLYRLVGIERVPYKNMSLNKMEKHSLSFMNNPKNGTSIYFAQYLMGIFSLLAILIISNTLSGWLGSNEVWKYGLFFSLILSFLFATLLAPNDPKKYLKEFKRIDKMQTKERMMIHFYSFFIVVLVVVGFVLSLLFYFVST